MAHPTGRRFAVHGLDPAAAGFGPDHLHPGRHPHPGADQATDQARCSRMPGTDGGRWRSRTPRPQQVTQVGHRLCGVVHAQDAGMPTLPAEPRRGRIALAASSRISGRSNSEASTVAFKRRCRKDTRSTSADVAAIPCASRLAATRPAGKSGYLASPTTSIGSRG